MNKINIVFGQHTFTEIDEVADYLEGVLALQELRRDHPEKYAEIIKNKASCVENQMDETAREKEKQINNSVATQNWSATIVSDIPRELDEFCKEIGKALFQRFQKDVCSANVYAYQIKINDKIYISLSIHLNEQSNDFIYCNWFCKIGDKEYSSIAAKDKFKSVGRCLDDFCEFLKRYLDSNK